MTCPRHATVRAARYELRKVGPQKLSVPCPLLAKNFRFQSLGTSFSHSPEEAPFSLRKKSWDFPYLVLSSTSFPTLSPSHAPIKKKIISHWTCRLIDDFLQFMTLSGYLLPFSECPGSKVSQEQAHDVESGILCQSYVSSSHGCKIISKLPFLLGLLGEPSEMMHVKHFVNWKAPCIYSTPTYSPSSVRTESRITISHVASPTLGEMKLQTGKSGHPSQVCYEWNHLPAESGPSRPGKMAYVCMGIHSL